ncbi:MAG: PKD domain-containing protein [Methylococcaceae bacterium]
MALGIITDFIGTPLNAAPPFNVAFTDLSEVTDGFKRAWFWDFGDGSTSTEQNPTHEYDGDGGESFDVKLKVIVTSGEFDVLATQVINAVSAGAGSWERNGLSLVSEPLAWEDFQLDAGAGGTNVFSRHTLSRTGGTDRQYKNVISDISLTSNLVQTDDIINTLVFSPSDLEIFQGAANANGVGKGYSNNDIRQFHSVIEGMVQGVPYPFSTSVTPVAPLPDTETTNRQHGLSGAFDLLSYIMGGTQTSDTELKTGYITVGTPPLAAFDAFPTAGPNPLPVQFENLSTPAQGAETTYTWKKRLSGSGDPFTTFSTDENPLEIFTK